RYGLAIMELEPRFSENPDNAELGDLLTYAQIRAGRFFDADATLAQYEQFGTLTGFGHALKAVLATYLNQAEVSRAAEREAILESPGAASTRSAMAYMALIRGDARTMGEIADTLIRDAGQYSETQYLVSAMYYRVGRFDASREAFQAALLADPLNYDMHVERANQALRTALDDDTEEDEKEFQLEIAASYLDAALIARPESFEALTGLAVVRSAQGQNDTAVQLAEAATNAGPDYAAGWYVLSAVRFDAREDGASDAMDRAGELDNRRLRGRGLPRLEQAWDYFFRYGRLPVMPAID
ncbi:MAG: tetratricopeptide repeat protein, partial [Fimbriimonadaceae bacterium]